MKKITTGSGITARTIELHPFTREAVPAFGRAKGDGGFDARIAAIEAWAAPIAAGLSWRGDGVEEPDSPEGYARRLLMLIKRVRRFIAEGDASRAARFAVDLGIVFDEMLMKAEWERPALVGVARRESAGSATALKESARIIRVAIAAELWKESANESRLSKVRVGLVAGWLDVSERTAETLLRDARAAGLIVN